ncbi:hypothetical protein [uncultured Anaerococcus sp.]|uniref:hypothetical protein n=1 Tax=uncultured Anaerococcus sp. TaxID=293428 RepID=UPI00261E7495|nr:hypothetical protein [uncultured Anaerococcus sp.]
MMRVDLEKTKEFYFAYNDLCDCDLCRFYRENIKDLESGLDIYLGNKNIEIAKPYELAYPYVDNSNNLIYPFAQYLVIGYCQEGYEIVVDGFTIKKADSFPDIATKDDYFILEVYDISFDKDNFDRSIIDHL